MRLPRSDILWRPTHDAIRDERRTADAVYGVIVGSGVMASAHLPTSGRLALAVLATLVVYWAAERYARLVADRIHAGRKPTWREAARQLGQGWEIVTASALPLIVLAALTERGVSMTSAVFSALVCSTLLLCLAGWEMGRGTRLSPLERMMLIVVAGAFGGLMIGFKALLH